jgi:uncharacterized protein YjbI with pentapeptide repeats
MMVWALTSLGVLFSLLIMWFVPKLQARGLDPKVADQRFLAENEARKTLAQIVGGFAILAGLYFTYANLKVANDQFKLLEAGQLADRFNKETEQLGSKSVGVRLGAILAFQRQSQISPDDSWDIMSLLCSWIQSSAPWPPSESSSANHRVPIDIQEALDVLAARDLSRDGKDEYLDLSGTDLRGAYLVDHRFSNMFLENVHFDGADLHSAHLLHSSVIGASFKGAHLEGADMGVWKPVGAAELGSILEGSFGDAETKLPTGVEAPHSWNVRRTH